VYWFFYLVLFIYFIFLFNPDMSRVGLIACIDLDNTLSKKIVTTLPDGSYHNRQQLLPESLACLEYLHATNTPLVLVSMNGFALKILRHLHIAHFFDERVVAYYDQTNKISHMQQVAERLKISDMSQLVLFDDLAENVMAAISISAQACKVDPESGITLEQVKQYF